MAHATDHPTDAAGELSLSAAGMRLVRLLVGKPPQSVAELIREVGVTRTAVTEQLNELVAAGFAERTTERLAGRGRPRHRYAASGAAMVLLFAGNQRLLVPAIWRALREIGGEQLIQKVLHNVSRQMAEHYGRQIAGRTPEERLRELTELLRREGDVVDVEDAPDGGWILRKRSCGFYSMFEETRSVCCVDEEMTARIVGAPVQKTACRHDGAPCCQFVLLSSNGRSPHPNSNGESGGGQPPER